MSTTLVDAPTPTMHGLEEIEAIARACNVAPAADDDDDEKTLARIESHLEVLATANHYLARPNLHDEARHHAAKWVIVEIALEEGFIEVEDHYGLSFEACDPSDFSSVGELGLYMAWFLGGRATDLPDEIQDERWEGRDFLGWLGFKPVTPVLHRIAPRPREGRVRRRRNRSSSRRGPPSRSDDDPEPPRPSVARLERAIWSAGGAA
jgi:hypothetical protein